MLGMVTYIGQYFTCYLTIKVKGQTHRSLRSWILHSDLPLLHSGSHVHCCWVASSYITQARNTVVLAWQKDYHQMKTNCTKCSGWIDHPPPRHGVGNRRTVQVAKWTLDTGLNHTRTLYNINQILPACNYCHLPWCVGYNSYHKALLIMFRELSFLRTR